MKKYSIPICVVILIISMCFCAFSQTPTTYQPIREGIWPYEFTERDKSLLRDFGLNVGNNAMMYQFNAPEEAIELLVRVYQVENNRWQLRDKFGISIGEEREPVDRLSGILSVHKINNTELVFRIHCAGLAEYPVKFKELETVKIMAYGQDYLDRSFQIQTGNEIPIMQFSFNDESRISTSPLKNYLYKMPETVYEESIYETNKNFLDILVTVTFNETDQYKNIEIEA